MRILIISRSPWRRDNSFGNSYSNIFSGVNGVSIANIYLADGLPEYDEKVDCFYQVSERLMLKSIFTKNIRVGEKVTPEAISPKVDKNIADSKSYNNLITLSKKKRWPALYMLREVVWRLGRIDMDGIEEFIEQYHPDLIFLPFYYARYVNNLAIQIKKRFDIPMVLEASSDVYSLKQISFDPLFWVNRFMIRRTARRVVKLSELMFVISKKMKKDYEHYLGIKCELLYKMPDLSRRKYPYLYNGKKLSFLFTGNVEAGRWKSLGILADAIKRNSAGRLDIYTNNPISCKMKKALAIDGFSFIHPPVSQEEVISLQNSADVLVHAESFSLANRLDVRYAISTKIMDYLSVGRTILAIGPSEVASMQYLTESGAALIANSSQDVYNCVRTIKFSPSLLNDYSEKGYQFVANSLDYNSLKLEFKSKLQAVINNYYKKKYENDI